MDVKTVSKPAVQPSPPPKRTEEQQQASSQDNRPKSQESSHAAPPKPTPVVNTQGQVTGRHLNVTA